MKKFLLAVFAIVGLTLYQFEIKAETKLVKLSKDNLLVLEEQFNDQSVAKVQLKAMELCAKAPNSDMYLFLSSPGGSVIAGMDMINTLNSLNCKFHTITAFAASMGYQTVQHLGDRYILPHGILMSHRARLGGIRGQIPGEFDSRLMLYKDLTTNIDKITSKRVGMSLEAYKEAVHDELWLTGVDAVDKGHADYIAQVVCDKSLQGTETKVVDTFFGQFEVKVAKCPVIRGYVDVKGLKGESVEDFYKHIEEQQKPIFEF